MAARVVDAILAVASLELVSVDARLERDAWRWLRSHVEREYPFVDATSVGDWCGVHDGRSDENEKERRIQKMPDEMRADWKRRAEPRIERSRAK